MRGRVFTFGQQPRLLQMLQRSISVVGTNITLCRPGMFSPPRHMSPVDLRRVHPPDGDVGLSHQMARHVVQQVEPLGERHQDHRQPALPNQRININ